MYIYGVYLCSICLILFEGGSDILGAWKLWNGGIWNVKHFVIRSLKGLADTKNLIWFEYTGVNRDMSDAVPKLNEAIVSLNNEEQFVEPLLKVCLNCGTVSEKMDKCLICKQKYKAKSYYCSKNCQRKDWPAHRFTCTRVLREADCGAQAQARSGG